MRGLPRSGLLDVVECELDQRPDAPVMADLEPHVTGVSRSPSALTITFAAEARETLEAFVAAERQCCAGLGWSVDEGAELRLRVEAGPEALDALATLFDIDRIEKSR